MRYPPRLIVPPTVEPIHANQLQVHVRTEDHDDSYLNRLIPAARKLAEDQFELSLATQTWRLVLDNWWVSAIMLPRPPIQSIDKVSYLDAAVTWQDLDPGQYYFDADTRLLQWANAADPSPELADSLLGRVRIDFVTGFTSVPESAVHALLMLCGHFYENREALTDGIIPEEIELAFSHLMYSNTEDYL